MTQFFFPFTSIDGDRRYNAKDFATYFHSIFTDGVIATVKDKLRVSQSEATGMHVVVNTGAAFIHGHLYLLGEPLTVDVTPGNSTGDRVDSIVLQLDHLERDMKILYKQNSTNVQRDENYWELQLATINVPRNATKVLNSQINDMRASENVAGYSKLQGNLDVEGMEQHYESLLQQLTQDMATWSTDKQTQFQDDWDIWFATVRDALDGDTAGNLLSMITQLQTDLGNIDAPSTQEFESLQSDFSAHQADYATLTTKGHIQLSSATNSTSETLAATPKAVKVAYDRADQAFTYGNNRKTETVDALLSVDDSLPITNANNWGEVIGAISGISTGKKWAKGSYTANQDWQTNANFDIPLNLNFEPNFIIVWILDEFYALTNNQYKGRLKNATVFYDTATPVQKLFGVTSNTVEGNALPGHAVTVELTSLSSTKTSVEFLSYGSYKNAIVAAPSNGNIRTRWVALG